MFYEIMQQEQQLLSSNINTSELSILQNSIARLQFFHFQKKNFIKSTNDDYKNLRIIILTLLTKIYTNYSIDNQNRLNSFKKIVYSSQLKQLTKSKGLLKQQLHKIIAIQFNKMNVGFQAESYLINMFNCVPFFDQILLRSIQQSFSYQSQTVSIEIVQKQLQNHFKFYIVWQVSNIQNQKQNQIFLWKEKDNILRQSALNMTFIGESSQEQSNSLSNPHIRLSSGKNRRGNQSSQLKMFQTISIDDSKSPFQFQNSKKRQMQNHFQSQTISGFMNAWQKNEIQILKSPIKIKQPSKPRSLWDLLCCSKKQPQKIQYL